jgi:hypothetical protein
MNDCVGCGEFPTEDGGICHRLAVKGHGYQLTVGPVLSDQERQYMAEMYDSAERIAAQTLGQVRSMAKLKGFEPMGAEEVALCIAEGEGHYDAPEVAKKSPIAVVEGHKLFMPNGECKVIPILSGESAVS